MPTNEFDHFLDAQDAPAHDGRSVYDHALAELTAGQKTSHWMWFIFPQLRGLGHSAMAQRYALDSLDQARRYLAHPILGPRLLACTQAVLAVQNRSLHAIFGSPDDLKFHSAMTLFSLCSPPNNPFTQALAKYCANHPDPQTLHLLNP